MIHLAPNKRLLFFRTRLGWMGLVTENGHVKRLKFGSRTREELMGHFTLLEHQISKPDTLEAQWIEQLKEYAEHGQGEIHKIPIDLSERTEFQKSVISQCQKIPFAKTLSYGEVAAKAGSPRAARAVGSVMKQNNVPLIVPCHRVVASTGLGGFNNPRGVEMKVRLLKLEGNKEFII